MSEPRVTAGPRNRKRMHQSSSVVSRTVTYHQRPPFIGTCNPGVSGENRKMYDIVTPKFESLRAAGVVINNPCSWTKDVVVRTFCPINRVCSNTPQVGDAIAASWGAAPLPVPPSDPALYSIDMERLVKLATTTALGGIAPPDATSLLTLGELGETVALLRNPVNALTTSFRRLTKLKREYWKLRASGVAANAIASQYLAVMFGMQPLINDVNTYMGLLSRFVPPRRTSRAKAQDSATRSESADYRNPWGQPFVGSTYLTGTLEVTVRAGSLYEYAYQDNMSAIFGFRVADVPIAMWQLTKMSFLVDWAFNVSHLLKALTPVAGVHRLAEWYTVKTVCTETIKLSELYHQPIPGWTGTGGGDTVTRVVESYTRHPCNLGDHVGLTHNVRWNPTKTLLSLALLTQQVSTWARGKPIPLTIEQH